MSNLDLLITSDEIAKNICVRFKHLRKKKHITQISLSNQSGVSYGSIKRFEQTGEISLISLIKISKIIGCVSDFDKLFEKKAYSSIEEVLND